jgi:hypothetical protein
MDKNETTTNETQKIPKDPILYTAARFYNTHVVCPILTFAIGAGLTFGGIAKLAEYDYLKTEREQIALAKEQADKNNGMVTFCDISNTDETPESRKGEHILQNEKCHTVTYVQAVQEITERKNKKPYTPIDYAWGISVIGILCDGGGMLSKFGMDKAADFAEAHYADEVTRNRAIAFS